MGKYKLFRSPKDGQWYWSLVAGNGEVIATSEGYTSKQAAEHGIDSVRSHAPGAPVEIREDS